MTVLRPVVSSILLVLALSACGQKEAPAPSSSKAPPSAPVAAAPSIPEAKPLTPQEMSKLTFDVYERFKASFPQTADFKTAPVVIRIEPVSGVEMFEVTTPNGIFYTDRQATWMIEGVMMMPSPDQDPTAVQQALAAGLPPPLMNVTMRPDAQQRFALIRDKEAAARATGAAAMSSTEIYKAMPREKAITLDYGRPDHDIVLLADILDPVSHRFFNELSKLDPNQVNLRLSVFPVGLEEIRPEAIAYASSLVCVDFDPAQPTASNKDRVASLWKSFMSDSVALTDPAQAWTPWAQANGIASPAHEACSRNIEPGVFTRLANSLGLFGSPIALLPNGKVLSSNFSLATLREALAAPVPPPAPVPTSPPTSGQ